MDNRFTTLPIIIKRIICCSFLLVLICNSCGAAELLERVVAIIDDEVILLSEFKKAVQSAEKAGEKYTQEDVINQMINRIILLRDAEKFGITGRDATGDNKTVINEYIERRIKAFIHIPFERIESYYRENPSMYSGKEFYDVKDEIEKYLVSRELVKRLQEYLDDQRNKSYIRIQLEDKPPLP